MKVLLRASTAMRLACGISGLLIGLNLTRPASADVVTDIKVTNNTGLVADDLEMSFAGTGGISGLDVIAPAGDTGSYTANMITIDFANGLPNGATTEFKIAAATGPPDLAVLTAFWTFKNFQNNGTNDPIPVPSKDISIPEPSTLLLSGIGIAALVGGLSRRRRKTIH